MGGEGRVTTAMSDALTRDFGSVQRWRTQFSAMGYALGGGSGWVLLSWMPRDGRLINQYASEHSQAIANAILVLALDMLRERLSHGLRRERDGPHGYVYAQCRTTMHP